MPLIPFNPGRPISPKSPVSPLSPKPPGSTGSPFSPTGPCLPSVPGSPPVPTLPRKPSDEKKEDHKLMKVFLHVSLEAPTIPHKSIETNEKKSSPASLLSLGHIWASTLTWGRRNRSQKNLNDRRNKF